MSGTLNLCRKARLPRGYAKTARTAFGYVISNDEMDRRERAGETMPREFQGVRSGRRMLWHPGFAFDAEQAEGYGAFIEA